VNVEVVVLSEGLDGLRIVDASNGLIRLVTAAAATASAR
jgi:hypothetical protein